MKKPKFDNLMRLILKEGNTLASASMNIELKKHRLFKNIKVYLLKILNK